MEQLIKQLESLIEYEKNRKLTPKDITNDWTIDYRAGHIDGLAKAIEFIKDYNNKN